MKKLILLFLILSLHITAQNITLKGRVTDAITNTPLGYANVMLAGTNKGTSANDSGYFEMKLKSGKYKVLVSYLGYETYSEEIDITENMRIEVKLKKSSIELENIVIYPGVNKALEIIRRAVFAKEEMLKLINSYTFDAYSKGIIRQPYEDTVKQQVKLDSLEIQGIFENSSKGYFLKPDYYKEEIIARRQTANFPANFNLLTGNNIVQNVYLYDLNILGNNLIAPVSEAGLAFYDFYIEDSLAQNGDKVYKIKFEPYSPVQPGLDGYVYIKEKDYSLTTIVAKLNPPANPGGIFKEVQIIQQFNKYENKFILPIDYRVFAHIDYLGFVEISFEIAAVMYDYSFNIGLDENFFDSAAIKVKSKADNKENNYWENIKTLPYTADEERAYAKIDSLENIKSEFWESFSLFSEEINLTKNIFFSGPLSLYSFNKIEGHKLGFYLGGNNLLDKRFNFNGDFSYGFSDRIVKEKLLFEYFMGEYRTNMVYFEYFNKLNRLYTDNYASELISSLWAFIFHEDIWDYYYKTGFNLGGNFALTPFYKIKLNFENTDDVFATNNTEFSIFNKDKIYSENRQVAEGTYKLLTFSVEYDSRKYIEDGFNRIKISGRNGYFILEPFFRYSNKSILGSDIDLKEYGLNIDGRIPSTFGTGLSYKFESNYSADALPFQYLKHLPGNLDLISNRNTFSTLRIGEILASTSVRAFLIYNFGDEIFRNSGIPLLNESGLNLTGHLNIAYTELNEKTKALNEKFLEKLNEFKLPLYEIGFGLSYPIIPVSFQFTWRLTHNSENNFAFGLRAFNF